MLAAYKAHRRLPHPGRQAERRALSPGEEPQGGLPNPESGVGSDGKRKKIGTHPSSFPSPDPSAIPTSAVSAPPCFRENGTGTARNAGKGSLLKECLRERARSVFFNFFLHGQSAPLRADSACSALKQTTHRVCVSPAEKVCLQGGTHSL